MVSVIFAVLGVSFWALTTVVKLPWKFLTLFIVQVDLSRFFPSQVKSDFLEVVDLSRPDDIPSRSRSDYIGTGDSQVYEHWLINDRLLSWWSSSVLNNRYNVNNSPSLDTQQRAFYCARRRRQTWWRRPLICDSASPMALLFAPAHWRYHSLSLITIS